MASDTVLLVVNILASFTALYMCMCPAPELYRIFKHKSTGHMPALPIVAQWTYNHTWMLYGFLTKAYFPLFVTYAIGSSLSVIFLVVFYWASARPHRRPVAHLVAVATLFNLTASGYAIAGPSIQHSDQVIQITGFLAIGCGVALYASPFGTIRHVLRTKNAASIPIAMVAVGTVSNATWIVYGMLAQDLFIVCPTVANTCLCVAQLLLYVAYSPSKARRKDAALSEDRCDSLSDSTSPDSSSSSSSASEHELSFVMLETPRYTTSSQYPPTPAESIV